LNDIFGKTNPSHVCLGRWSIETRDRIKYHFPPFLKRKDLFPGDKERQQGVSLLSKLRELAFKHHKFKGDYISCFVLGKKQIICTKGHFFVIFY